MFYNLGTRFLIKTVFLFVFIAGVLSSCSTAPFENKNPATPVEATIISTATPTPITTLTLVATKLPSATVTNVPLSQTSDPRSSITAVPVEPSPTKFPQPIIIGYSVTERPLEVFHFGDGPQKRMIIAGIHGGYEWNTIALADQLIKYLIENPNVVPEHMTLYVLRSANPDGEVRVKGSAGRANENGVDINRNFPANWSREWDQKGCWNHLPITAGTRPMSEPETGAIMRFILSNRIEALISYHSAALGIFAGGQPPYPESHNLAKTLAAVAPYTYPPPYETGCEYTGQMTDWAANHNIAAVDIELTNHNETDYYINLEILKAFLGWDKK